MRARVLVLAMAACVLAGVAEGQSSAEHLNAMMVADLAALRLPLAAVIGVLQAWYFSESAFTALLRGDWFTALRLLGWCLLLPVFLVLWDWLT